MRKFPLLLFAVLLAGAAALILSFTEQLPELVAVHFDASGRPNGFTTREGCRDFMLISTLGAPLFIAIVTALIPRLLPPSMVNIPHREYWLAPERARDSIAFMSEQGIWFACILVVFIADVDWMLVRANAVSPPAFPSSLFIATLMLFFCAVGFWAVCMFKRFRRP
jgi:uncharacterized membrane protein